MGRHLLRVCRLLRHRNMAPCIRHHLCQLQVQLHLSSHWQVQEFLLRFPGIDPLGHLLHHHQYPSEQGYNRFHLLTILDLNPDKGRPGRLLHHHRCQLPFVLTNNHQYQLQY